MNEHICMVCFMSSDRHDPYTYEHGERIYCLPPLCCHGCGCGEEQPAHESDDLAWPYVGAKP